MRKNLVKLLKPPNQNSMDLKLVNEAGDLRGKYVILRASFNVPLKDGAVLNAYRLERALPTLRYLREAGARTIVISHLGRKETDTLQPVFEVMNQLLPMTWGGVITDLGFASVREAMQDGDIVCTENLRQDAREEENDDSLAEMIASYGEVYVNDAFAEAHREHASTYGAASRLPAYAGFTLAEEVRELSKVMTPQSPSLFILGGAKFETKIPLVEKYLALYDRVFIGGALANDVLKARGVNVGKSLVSDVSLADADFINNPKLMAPVDVIVKSDAGVRTCVVAEVCDEEAILDIGPATVELLQEPIQAATTILWNGPVGNYEGGFPEGTEAVAKLIAAAPGFSVLGGGDTVAAVEKLGLNEQFGFISIGGGSMLTLLEHGSTPALDLLKR